MNRRTASKLLVGGVLGAAGRSALGAQMSVATSMPKFSCMLWTLEGKAPFDRCLEIVAAAGYGGVELVGEFQRWSPEETKGIVARLRALNLTVDAASGVKTGFAVPDGTTAFLAEFKSQLQAMDTFGCHRVILLSGAVVSGISPAEQRKTALDNLAKAADLAAGAQVEILIEPIDPLENPTIFLRSVTEGFSLARALNRPNLKVLYDLYHEQRAFGNLIEKLEVNIDWVGLVHVADVPGRHEPGTGEIDYATIYRSLAKMHYDRWIAMEFYPTGEPVASLRAARLQAEAAFAG